MKAVIILINWISMIRERCYAMGLSKLRITSRTILNNKMTQTKMIDCANDRFTG